MAEKEAPTLGRVPMTDQVEKEQLAEQFARNIVERFRQVNLTAESRGAPKLPEHEYEELRQTLARKLIRDR